jgi:hypothetical protein
MAQAQLMFTSDTLQHFEERGFQNLIWSPIRREITCYLPNEYILVLKKRRSQIKCYLRVKNRRIQLPLTVVETLCDLKESILMLSSFLEGHSS